MENNVTSSLLGFIDNSDDDSDTEIEANEDIQPNVNEKFTTYMKPLIHLNWLNNR